MIRELVANERPGWITVRIEFQAIGELIQGHAHAFDHWTEAEAGAFLLRSGGETHIVEEGARRLVPAHIEHEIIPIAPGTVMRCEHEIRRQNGELDPDAFSPDGIPLEWIARLTDAWGLSDAR